MSNLFTEGFLEILEELGFEVYLVNARHTKNLPGRKSDVQDSQWLLKLQLAMSIHHGHGNFGKSLKQWGGRWESNPQRPEPQSGALPVELLPPYSFDYSNSSG